MAGQSQIPLYVPGDRGTIAQLLMAQGEAQARGAERSGQIWGNAVNQIGQLAGGAVQQYQEDKLLKRREAAIDSVMGSWDGQDAMQLYRGLAPIIGPEKAQHVAQGLAETRLAAEKLRRGEMPSREDTAAMIHTAGALEDAQPGYLSKPQNYSLFKQVAGPGVLAHFGYQLPDEPTPEVLQGIQTIYKQVLAQPKGAATKTVTVRQPDGSEVTKIVEDKPGQEFVSAPKPEPSLQQIQAEAEARARGTRMGAPPAEGSSAKPKMYEVDVPGPDGTLMKKLFTEDEMRRGVRVAPKSTGNKPVTEVERKNLGFYNRAKESIDTLEGAPSGGGKTLEGRIASAGYLDQVRLQSAPNFLQSDDQQSYRQAQRAFTEARLRKESGAAIPESEFQNDARTYFAQPGDSAKTIEQKRKSRAVVLAGLKYSAGRAYDEYYGSEAAPAAAALPPESQAAVDRLFGKK